MQTWTSSPLLGILFAAVAGCGGQTAGASISNDAGFSQNDAGTQTAGQLDASDGDDSATDASAASGPVGLLTFAPGEYLGLIAFDDQYVYAGLFSSDSTNGDICGWQSRWVRVAKDGSSSSDLGDASTCIFNLNATAVVLDGSLYWLGWDSSDGGGVTSLMTMPTTGGSATRLRDFPQGLDGIGTDGSNLFAVSTGTDANYYSDGAVLRLGLDGTPTTLASNQTAARWIGITNGALVWSVSTDCGFENTNCQSTTFLSSSTTAEDGGAATIAVVAGSFYPATASNGSIFFMGSTSVLRLSLSGSQTTFVTVPWESNGYLPIDRLRISGTEVIAGSDDTDTDYLLAQPIPFDPPFVQSVVFDVDNGFAYAQLDGGLQRLPVP